MANDFLIAVVIEDATDLGFAVECTRQKDLYTVALVRGKTRYVGQSTEITDAYDIVFGILYQQEIEPAFG